jgi:hypothetical protein
MNSGLLAEMHLTTYSAAAYAVAWVIYLGYLGRILLRMKKVAAERVELERTVASPIRQQILTTEAQRH